MATIKFEIVSDKFGKFNVDSSYTDDQLNCYITRDHYSCIISKINQRIKNFKSPLNVPCLVGIVIIIISIMIFIVVEMQSQTPNDIYGFIIFISMMIFMTACCALCAKFSAEQKERRFKKLQSDIQTIADIEFMTIYQIAYAKWTIEKIGDGVSGKRFKLTAEFRLQQQRTTSATVPSVREPIDWRSVPVDSPAIVLGSDAEQTITSLNNEQHCQDDIASATLPPPYYKVVHLFSQGTFSDCSNCGNQKCVFNRKYCTQCGHSL